MFRKYIYFCIVFLILFSGCATLKSPNVFDQAEQAGKLTVDAVAQGTGGGTGSVATDSIWDAAGDMVYGTGSNTAGRFAIGTAYQILMVNSGATAPAWTSTIGATGTRLTKGWFTDLEITNLPTVNGGTLASALSLSSYAPLASPSLTGDPTITDATPTFICIDSDTGAAGTCGTFANSAGTQDIIWSFGVEDSTGASTEYFQIDGVTETVDFSKPITLPSGGFSVAATSAGGQYDFGLEDADNGTNYAGDGIYGDITESYIKARPKVAPLVGQIEIATVAKTSRTMADNSSKDVSEMGWVYPSSTYNAAADGMADDNYNGDTIIGRNCGEGLTQWDTVRLVNDADPFHQADADAAGEFPAIGIAVAACTDTNPAVILVKGVARNEGWTGLTPGGKVYLSDTAGGVTQTPPATSGDCVQIVGWALSDSEIYFDFSRPYVELE